MPGILPRARFAALNLCVLVSKSTAAFAILICFALFAGAQPSVAAAQVKIAIIEFDALNQLAKAGGWGRSVSEALTTAAVNSGAFAVVERHLLQKIMSEQLMGDREQGFASEAQSVANMAGADYVLSGSVRKEGNQLSIAARLVDVASGAILTAQNVASGTDPKSLTRNTEKIMEAFRQRIYGDAPPQPAAPAAGAPASPAAAPLSLQVKLAAPGGVDILLKEGDTLTSADGYFVEVASGRTAYVYVAQVDASGSLYALFPNPSFSPQQNPLPPGRVVRVPAGENFHLDDNTGKETIHALAATGPMPDVERIFQHAANADPFAMEDLVRQLQDAMQRVAPEYRASVWLDHQ